MQLRGYQDKAVEDVRAAYAAGVRRPLLVMPTGAGKTQVLSYIAKGIASKGKRVMILAHRRELLTQISNALTAWGVRHSIIDAESPGIPRTNVVVGSVFTVYKRLRHMPHYDLIIQDEAHHCSGTNTFSKVLQHYPTARQLGVTATPARASQEPLGDSFDRIVMGPTAAELMGMGYLCPIEVYAPSTPDLSGVSVRAGDYAFGQLNDAMNKPVLVGDAVTHYRKYGQGKLAVAFCVSIEHSMRVAEAFRAAGYRSHHVDGKMDSYTRDKTLRDFANKQMDVLTSCSLITEGWDCPQVEVGLMLRPTQSMPLYIQMAGRLARPFPGKSRAILLDSAGLTARHGFIDDPREWTLDGATKDESESVPRVVTCERCFAAYRPSTQGCPRCGHVNKAKPRHVKQVDGELAQVTDASEYDAPRTGDMSADLRRQYEILKRVAPRRGIRDANGWAWSVISARLAEHLRTETMESRDAAIEEMRQATVERDRVMTAMGREQPVEPVPGGG